MPTLSAAEIQSHRAYLVRVAQLQLRDRDAAEDAVQETLVAALQAMDRFSGGSTVRTWLTGILKHKIVDAIRRRAREAPAAQIDQYADGDPDETESLFAEDGHWATPPASWGDPTRSLERREFFDILEICMERLPANTARVFVMREVMELESDEICKELRITTTNLWVILYRARMALRECLEQKWFASHDAALPR